MVLNMENVWLQFGVHVFVGTMAGGLSDTVAVWMLFNPKQKKFGFQGAIPKNQARMARKIGIVPSRPTQQMNTPDAATSPDTSKKTHVIHQRLCTIRKLSLSAALNL